MRDQLHPVRTLALVDLDFVRMQDGSDHYLISRSRSHGNRPVLIHHGDAGTWSHRVPELLAGLADHNCGGDQRDDQGGSCGALPVIHNLLPSAHSSVHAIMAENDPKPSGKPCSFAGKRPSDTAGPLRHWDPPPPTVPRPEYMH